MYLGLGLFLFLPFSMDVLLKTKIYDFNEYRENFVSHHVLKYRFSIISPSPQYFYSVLGEFLLEIYLTI